MRFINKCSYAGANYIMQKSDQNHEKRRIYYFGLQIFIGAVIETVILLVTAYLLGILLPVLIIVGVFSSLRKLAGGFHMDTYGKCMAVSMGLFIAAGIVSQYTYMYWGTGIILGLIAVSFLTALFILYKWAPLGTPNKPITKPSEIKKFKIMSIVFVFVWLVLVLLLVYYRVYSYDMFAIAACFGLLLEIFTVTPSGHRFFHRINGNM